jgi:hypothetical protein
MTKAGRFTPISVEFADRATRSRFDAVILALIRREHPEAFEGE